MSDLPFVLTPQRVRHPIRYRLIEVVAIDAISPHMRRIVFGGEALEGFYSPGFDDHVKLVLPAPGEAQPVTPIASDEGLRWASDVTKPLMRDYTPRAFDQAAGRLTIDFALHDAGPATRWALNARVGDKLGLAGPRGSLLVPADYDWHLLVGDDTAIPAIARRLAELPATARAVVAIEVDEAADRQVLTHDCSADIHWVYREGVPAGESHALIDYVRELNVPDGMYYAWVACETHVAQALRRILLERKGASRDAIKAAGYWRLGNVGVHEPLAD